MNTDSENTTMDCHRSAGSLEELQGGFYLASLPKIVDGKLLKVEVDRWDAYGTEVYEMTVRLATGLLSKRSLYDEELEGAEFFHLKNTEGRHERRELS